MTMANTFFGIQLAIDLPPGHGLRRRLGGLVRELRGRPALPLQLACWSSAAQLLDEALPSAVLGTWDLIRDRGDAEFEDWSSGLEAMARWDPAEFGEGGSLLLVSLIMLVAGGSNADRTLGDLCDLPQREWLRRGTYRRLVAAPPQLNLTNVMASGVYLAPHPDRPGFSRAVLQGEGFEYLEAVGG